MVRWVSLTQPTLINLKIQLKAIFNAKSNEVDENFAFAPKSKYPDIKGIFDRKDRFKLEEIVPPEKVAFEKT